MPKTIEQKTHYAIISQHRRICRLIGNESVLTVFAKKEHAEAFLARAKYDDNKYELQIVKIKITAYN